MPNLSYCRFRNTLNDLRDCNRALHRGAAEQLTGAERRACRELIDKCADIAETFSGLADELANQEYAEESVA